MQARLIIPGRFDSLPFFVGVLELHYTKKRVSIRGTVGRSDVVGQRMACRVHETYLEADGVELVTSD